MRSLAGCLGMVIAILLTDASSSAQAIWCAEYRNGGTNCGFYTHAQCQATVSGIGGFCTERADEGRRPNDRADRTRTSSKQKNKVSSRQPERRAPVASPAPPSAPVPAAPAGAASPAPVAVSAPAPVAFNPAAFAAARQLILDGKYEAGLAAMKASGPENNPDLASYVGLAHRKLGQTDEAKRWYGKALMSDPKHLQTLAFYGVLRVEAGDLAGARTDLQKIRAICGNTSCNEYVGLAGVIAAKAQ